uniref:CUB domain-containing protein n=1 Tax=Steinernema glaseri TaxID=37863 RepID=A0A1I7Y806_9BILA
MFSAIEDDAVIVAQNVDYQMSLGGAIRTVFGDVYEMNNLYSCYDRCKDSGMVCHNEGMPHPRNCSVCQCPSGFGGNDCSEREAPSHGLTCGETLRAQAYWQALEVSGVVGGGNNKTSRKLTYNPHHCTWHIRAPEGKVIEHDVIFFGVKDQKNDILRRKMCRYGGLKINGQERTWISEGMKLCCSDQLKKIRTTVSNVLVVEAYNSWQYTYFKMNYKMVDAAEIKIPQATSPLSYASVSHLPKKLERIDTNRAYIPELQKSMRAIPGYLPPNIPEINAAAGLVEIVLDGDIVLTP